MKFGERHGRPTARDALAGGFAGVIDGHGYRPGTAGEHTLQPRPGQTFTTTEIHAIRIASIETVFQSKITWREPKLD